MENASKVLKWVNQVSIYRPRSSAHLASSKRSSEGFFTKKSRKNTISHELQQFRTIVRSGKFISTIFVFLEHFAWLCEISFHFSHLSCSQNPLWFARLCEFFACSCKIEKHGFSTSFCHFSHFFLLTPFPPSSIQLQSLFQVHCLFLIIHIVYPPPFHFSFVTQCFKNHLKISPKLHKNPLVSLTRVAMYYLGILGIITTRKVWNSWELVSKMCGFWVVIIPPNQRIANPLAMV